MTVRRVIVTRTGGFAGLRVSREVDDPAEAGRLTAAVLESAERPASSRARDGFVYEFTIVTTTTTETVDLTSGQLPEPLRRAVRSLLDRTP